MEHVYRSARTVVKGDDELGTQVLVDERTHSLRSGHRRRQAALTGGGKRRRAAGYSRR